MWAWMVAQLSHVGPRTPVLHQAHHDLKSFFYILLMICLLYDNPGQPKPAKVLAKCFDPFFTVTQPSILKTITVQSNFGWTAVMIPHISSYFQPVIPLLEKIRQELIIPIRQEGDKIHANQKFLQDDFIDAIVTTLSELPDSCWLAKEVKKGLVTIPQSGSTSSAASIAPQSPSVWSFPPSYNLLSPMFTLSNDPLPWLPPIHTSSRLSSQSNPKCCHRSQDTDPCLGEEASWH